MTSIPVAWLISIFALLIAAIVFRQVRMPLFARVSFGVALISIAVVAVFVGVRFQFNDPAFLVLQPYLAAVTAPAFWAGFHALTTQDGMPSWDTMRRGIGIVCLAWVITALPFAWSASAAVILVNSVYVMLLFGLLRLPAERYVHVPPQAFPALRISLWGSMAFLLLVLLIDSTVLGTGLAAGEARAMRLLSDAAVAVVATICLGVAAGLAFAIGAGRQPEDDAKVSSEPQDEDLKVFARLTEMMAETSLYRDSEITVARLGRRLGVPARSVSSAVNRVTGENISRYINGLRVQHAVGLLKRSDLPVTDIMLEAGFTSKSSFNTEFRRITGKTPSEYRKSGGGVAPDVLKPVSARSAS
ncbi:AraC family transcriptional regulator [Leisingera sp. ANG-DT]|uniref:AraC family transcriptional regulator n=1 Tax=Leisingera sp. ANG-DT TaxID=1577897 RepID=UPI00068C949C|nr:AraC family transcriptional regulator [Leisingera sp. ANG-DT]